MTVRNTSGARRRASIVAFIRDYMANGEVPPSIEDIRMGCGFRSVSTVGYHLLLLEKQALVKWTSGLARTVQLTGKEDVAR